MGHKTTNGKHNKTSATSTVVPSSVLRRALAARNKAANDNAFKTYMAASRGGARVLDDNAMPLPAEPGKVPWTVQLGDATLNFNASIEEMRDLAAHAGAVLRATVSADKHRSAARHLIVEALATGAQFDAAVGQLVASMAVWLALTGPQGPQVASGGLAYCAYVIEKSRQPGTDMNFRFLASFSTNANDNGSAAR